MKQLLWILNLLLLTGPCFAQVELMTRTYWIRDTPNFGGISGLEVDARGMSFVALSDQGLIIQGNFVRSEGEITRIESGPLITLQNQWGDPLIPGFNDAEGLAIADNGRLFVSFEGPARVWFYANEKSPAVAPTPHPDFEGMQANSSLEALAIDKDGWAYVLPERSGNINRPFQVYRTQGTGWSASFQIPRRGPFLPVGADIGPDNLFYLLERDFTGFGFRSRVRRFDLDGGQEELLLQTANAFHDNMEGISVWKDTNDSLRLTMVSDDNFQWFQRTEIVEYRLTE